MYKRSCIEWATANEQKWDFCSFMFAHIAVQECTVKPKRSASNDPQHAFSTATERKIWNDENELAKTQNVITSKMCMQWKNSNKSHFVKMLFRALFASRWCVLEWARDLVAHWCTQNYSFREIIVMTTACKWIAAKRFQLQAIQRQPWQCDSRRERKSIQRWYLREITQFLLHTSEYIHPGLFITLSAHFINDCSFMFA